MSYKYRVYLHGLIAAIVNSVSNSAVVVMVDPQQFNLFQGGAQKLAMVAGASAVFAFFTFLKEHPLPDPDKDTDFAAAQSKAVEKVMVNGTGDGTIPVVPVPVVVVAPTPTDSSKQGDKL